ncbi:MAG: hypothetical protein OEY43_04725 [Gammaproteobacteria bacterium]|nr:hypothetical protein [Gammaproteobacteria bacterium]
MAHKHAVIRVYRLIGSGIVTVLCLLLLTACERHIIADERSALYPVPVGSLLILLQAIEIPPGTARVFIQQGQVLPLKQVNQYKPHCEFEINSLDTSIQTIHPDRFTIYKVATDIRYVSRQALFASLSTRLFNDGDIVGFANDYYLRSASQPDVRKLSCLHWDDSYKRIYLSIEQVRQVLGKIFELQLAK